MSEALDAGRRPAREPRAPRRTVRLRLTLWYGGLFLACGAALLAVTYALVVQAFVGGTARTAACRQPGVGCHVIGAGPARAAALAAHAAVLHELLTRSLLALGLTAVLAVALGWLIAGRVLQPLRRITATVREISAARLSERLALGGPRDELSELADTFDGLLARLEASFEAQRQFIANASHELRTPLARQRVISQVALASADATTDTLRAAHERVLASGAEQQQLLDALLTLSRGQAGLNQREPFDLAALARQALAARSGEALARELTLHMTLDPPATAAARGRPSAWWPTWSITRCGTTSPAAGSRSALEWPAAAPSCRWPTPGRASRRQRSVGRSEPFQRLGADRTGHRQGQGLGLCIVRAVADAARRPRRGPAPSRPGGTDLLIEVAFPQA